MKIKSKLLLGLSTLPVLMILLIGVGWFQWFSLNKMNVSLQANYDSSFLAGQIHRKVKDEAIRLRNIVIMSDAERVQKEIDALRSDADSVTRDITLLDAATVSKEQRVMIEELKSTNQKFNAYKDNVIELVLAGKKEEAVQLISSSSQKIQDEFLQVVSGITDTFETSLKTSLLHVSQDFQRQMVTGSLISFIGTIIALLFLLKSVWTVAVRLNKVSQVMINVASGSADLDTRLEVKQNDEIDDVARSFNQMAHTLQEQLDTQQKQHWIKSNIAEITTSLTGAQQLEEFARAFLSKAVPLTGAAHAVFYIKETDEKKEPVFKLLASYAFKERKHLCNTFYLGEGLVGQAALEKSPILLTDVPSDYIRIRSGLGEAPPLNVYVLPVRFKDDVQAVVEIASFKQFTEEQQTFLDEMIENMGIILESVTGRIQLAELLQESQALLEELQVQSEELQSQQDELKATNEELEEQTQALRQSEEELQSQQEELEQTNAELKEKAAYLEIQNLKLETANKEIEAASAELEEKAKQIALSSKYKSEFLANMSHELRTPLNSLLILSKLLSENHDGNLTAKQIEYMNTIYSSGNDLLSLINDILNLAKIESGKMEVHPSKVYIQDLAYFVENQFKPIADEKKLAFNIELKDGLPSFLISDEQRLQQILKNLLSNAFKFTHKGSVTLGIDSNQRENGTALFTFTVKDTGIGIPAEKQDIIFHAFQQADGTTSRKYGGTGLGLSICRQLAELLGGEIFVRSEEGKGSEFTFITGDYQMTERPSEIAVTAEPVQLSSKAAEVEPVPVLPPKAALIQPGDRIKRLLIVDDDLRQRSSLMELIGNKNVILSAVSTGAEALEALKKDQYDCMVLDLGLTDTTGYDVLKKIKENPSNDSLKVLIYTGRDLNSKEEMQLQKHAHTIIIKDAYSPQRLLDELDLLLNTSEEKHSPGEAVEPEPMNGHTGLEGKKVLLVDDDVRNVYALSSILEMYGMNVTFAENGHECLAILENSEDIDLVLMDIMMPEMDGYETIQKIRGMEPFHELPIIALTAKAMKEDREKCMDAGSSDYIAKPIIPDQLISLMRVWLHPEGGSR